MSSLLWRKMLVAFLSAFLPLFLVSVIVTLEQVAAGGVDWRVVGIAFLTTGVLPAVIAGVRALIALSPWSLTPTDRLHGRGKVEEVSVDAGGLTSTTGTGGYARQVAAPPH